MIPVPSMQTTVDDHWRQGQARERAGDPAGAEAHYRRLVEHAPHHVPALLRLSRFCQARDDYPQARRHALAAADACRLAGSTRHLGHVTQRLLDFAEENEVASVVLSADWSDPDVVRQSAVLAQHLWLAGRYEDAGRFLGAIAPRTRANPPLEFMQGQLCQSLGQLAEAHRHYERTLQLDPLLSDAHWAIAKLAPSGAPARLLRLRAALAAPDLDAVSRAQLHYALFHERDSTEGDPDAAWESLAAGAALMAEQIRSAPRTDAGAVDALIASDWTPVAPGSPSHQQPLPIFVVGLPRSGTTLLDRMLGNHGWVTMTGERNDLRAAIAESTGRFAAAPRLHAADMGALDHADIGHRYRQRLRQAASATAFATDKNPQNLYRIPTILAALPEARILCVLRSPMDLAFSNLKEIFQGGAYAYSYAFDTLADEVIRSRRWMRHWARLMPRSVRVVEYETLVSDPEATINDVAAFLGLPYQPGLARSQDNALPVSTASSAQVRRPVGTEAIGAWKRYAPQLEALRQRLAGIE